MKRGVFILLLGIGFVLLMGIILFYLLILKTGVEDTAGETVTGEITDASLTVTISITGSPFLTIIKPLNQTYFENESLRLKVNANTNDMWYNLDKGDNITFLDETLFNTSEGSHTIYVFANNSFGITTKNVTFTINNSLYNVIHENYKGANKGGSTNFSEFSFTEIQSLSGVVLENTLYGKISFNETINVTDDADLIDGETNLETNTNISSNKIELNSTALPNFNKSATLYLYNLTLNPPVRILRDGSVCPSTICTQQSYTGGTLIFNVTGFTVYSAEETPSGDVEGPGGAGGSGGGGGVTFTISLDEIIISLKQGEIKTEEMTIKNQKNTKLSFLISSDMGEFIRINEESFELEPGEEKTISIDFIAKENTVPELYLGNLFIRAGGGERKIPVTIEVESAGALFDVEVEIPEEFRIIKPGDVLSIAVSIFNIRGPDSVNVEITYQIRNFKNEILLEDKETFAVKEEKNFIRNFKIPNNAKEGKYILYATIVYEGKTASSTAQFRIGTNLIRNIIIFIFIIILIIIIIILYNTKKYLIRHLRRKKKTATPKKKESLKKLIKYIKKKT